MPNPNPRFPTFLSPQTAQSILNTVQQGLATAEQLAGETVQFKRFNTVTGVLDNVGAPVGLISIDFGLREVRETEGLPIREHMSDGDCKMWAEDVAARGLRVKDKFTYKGMDCELSALYPESFGFVVAEIELQQ